MLSALDLVYSWQLCSNDLPSWAHICSMTSLYTLFGSNIGLLFWLQLIWCRFVSLKYLCNVCFDFWMLNVWFKSLHPIRFRDWSPKFATGLKCLNRYRSKSIWVTILFVCQNDSLMGGSLWQKYRMVTHMLFDLCLFKHFSPLASFGYQSLIQKRF